PTCTSTSTIAAWWTTCPKGSSRPTTGSPSRSATMRKMPVDLPLKLGFLASHGGSGMRAIVQAIRAGELPAEPRILISNNADCQALTFAAGEGIPTKRISAASEGGLEAADRSIAQALEAAGAELVVLSGYMRRLGPQVLRRYAGRILNIHPALLPRHGGQ